MYNDYLSTGELAVLFNINKQTLIYYDNIGLIKPDFIDENGYRFYNRKQYLTLEIITNLRKLDVSLKTIQWYLKNRNKENFSTLLANQLSVINKRIKTLQSIKNSIENTSNTIKSIQTQLNQIIIKREEKRIIYISDEFMTNYTAKQRLNLIGQFNIKAFDKNQFKYLANGWIIDKSNYLNQEKTKYKAIFSTICNNYCLNPTVLPEGYYCSYEFSGMYHKQKEKIKRTIDKILYSNQLYICSDIYLLAKKNHWLTNNYAEYINEIYFKVERV